MREARADLATRGTGVGFGFMRNLGFDGDKVRFLYAITDGSREACFQVLISGSQLSGLGQVDDIDAWVHDRLPTTESGGDSTYALILQAQPIRMW